MYKCSLIFLLFILTSCKKECQICTQMLSETYQPKREGYTKTISVTYNSCGPNNDWIGEQVKIKMDTLGDTIYTRVLSTDCK